MLLLALQGLAARPTGRPPARDVLDPQQFRHYFAKFVDDERAMLGQSEPLQWPWFETNIPWLDVPDKNLEEIYYFRWYTFQKHIKRTPDGLVIDEFKDEVPWAGRFNTISAAAGHHLREARWLRTRAYAADYARFWFGPNGEPRRYSFWAADSVYQLLLATADTTLAVGLLPDLQKNFSQWEADHQDPSGLFWQIDDRDGMEFSIGGSGYRPTINSYMYGDARAIARIADLARQPDVARRYQPKADRLRELVDGRLWNPNDSFYETVPRGEGTRWSGVRELIGFVPWYFDLPSSGHAAAWKQLFDPQGFSGRYGPTTAERRSPRFGFENPHECLWNGPSWPFATTQTLVALANLLDGTPQSVMSSADYFRLLGTYTASQHIRLPDGRVIPWIDEDLNADSGDWIARRILESRHQAPPNRGRYYNHSGFADVVITGLIGVRPSAGTRLAIRPLVPPDTWDYFALDGVPYHGHRIAVVYDRTGERYHRGVGLTVLADGHVIGHRDRLGPLDVVVPAAHE